MVKVKISLELPGTEELVDKPPLDLVFPTETRYGTTPEGLHYISRAFMEDVDIPTNAACAFSVMEQPAAEITLFPGMSEIVTVAFSS